MTGRHIAGTTKALVPTTRVQFLRKGLVTRLTFQYFRSSLQGWSSGGGGASCGAVVTVVTLTFCPSSWRVWTGQVLRSFRLWGQNSKSFSVPHYRFLVYHSVTARGPPLSHLLPPSHLLTQIDQPRIFCPQREKKVEPPVSSVTGRDTQQQESLFC